MSAQQVGPPAPRNLRIVSGPAPAPKPDPKPITSDPLPPSNVPVRSGHPRMHFTPESLATFKTWLAGPLKHPWQQYINKLNQQANKTLQWVDADMYALAYLAGNVPGINYGTRSPEAFGALAAQLVRDKVALGIENHGVNMAAVNHPFHSPGALFESMARAHDWLWGYPGYTAADKKATADYIMAFVRMQLEIEDPKTPGRARMSWYGPDDALSNANGTEHHHPWYYVLPLIGDGLIDDTKARQYLATFETHWLQGGWLDVSHYESRGAGTKALGSYGSWYPKRLILNFHAWKTATGQDYFNSPTPVSPDPAYFRNYPITYGVIRRPSKPTRVLPLGQTNGDAFFPADINRMLTGVLTGQPARWAAQVGGDMEIITVVDGFQFLTFDPTVPREPIPYGVVHYQTYGMLVDRREDGTLLTMAAPPIKLKGHTWSTQGGGPHSGVPLGVTLHARGVPILVKHVGEHRGNVPTFGQNSVRFYDPLIPQTNIVAWTRGGMTGTATNAKRVQEIKPSDDLGGIKTWTSGNPNRAVAELTKWYDPTRVKSYVRTYEWGPNFLRVIDDIETTRPDIMVWSRWYTGQVPTIGGVGVPTGFSERPAPDSLTLGPVTWTLVQKPASTLHIVGGDGYEFVDDLGRVSKNADDLGVLKAEGAAEIGNYTITFKSTGSGRWEHLFTW